MRQRLEDEQQPGHLRADAERQPPEAVSPPRDESDDRDRQPRRNSEERREPVRECRRYERRSNLKSPLEYGWERCCRHQTAAVTRRHRPPNRLRLPTTPRSQMIRPNWMIHRWLCAELPDRRPPPAVPMRQRELTS